MELESGERRAPQRATIARLVDALQAPGADRIELENAAASSFITALTNLPAQPTSFVGRAREITEIANLLRQDAARMITLTGPPDPGRPPVGTPSSPAKGGPVGRPSFYF